MISGDGRIRFIHSDDLTAALRDFGRVEIKRASHVEPNADAMWEADLNPSGGPILGPFSSRADALAAERNWLLTHM